MNKDIEQAITNLRLSTTRYAKPERYYNGDHDLAFATEKFQNTFGTLFREFALNLCPVICDAVRDKLRVTGFSRKVTVLRLRRPMCGMAMPFRQAIEKRCEAMPPGSGTQPQKPLSER